MDTSGQEGYTGDENVPVTNEETQASVYGALVRAAECDPDVAAVNLFGFRDDALRTGFQAGLVRADGTPRPALAAVQDAIAANACATGLTRWHPTRAVLGAGTPGVRLGQHSLIVGVSAAEGASARACLLRGAHTLSSARRALSSVNPAACTSGPSMRTARRRSASLGARGGRHWRCACLPARIRPARRLPSESCRAA